MNGAPALVEWRKITVLRGGAPALQEINLRIGGGEHVAILGPNGSGKSTLVKTITRECYPVSAAGSSLSILGREQWDVADLRRALGIVSNDLTAPCADGHLGRDVVLSGFFGSTGLWRAAVTDDMNRRAQAVLERLGAVHLAGRPVAELSSGEGRRLLLARALVHEPRALVLDEPGTGLDLAAAAELKRTLRRLAWEGVGIVLVTHHLADIVPEVERVVVLHRGRVVADGPKRDLLRPEVLQPVFGAPIEVTEHDGYFHAW